MIAALPPPAQQGAIPTLCVVIPVLNERANIAPMVHALDATLAGTAWEVMFVDDDSRDGTREEIARLAATDSRVRMIHRVGRRGLASAFIEGAQASFAPILAAIDGDMQHDETLLPAMLRVLQSGEADIAVGSRMAPGGDMGDFAATRVGMSRFATAMARPVLGVEVGDPMSGFFMLPREVFLRAMPRLSAMGFKILVDIVASLPTPPRVKELGYRFRTRQHGESKLDAGVVRDFFLLLVDKMVGHIIPVRFLLFAGVGAVGIAAHLAVLRLCMAGFDLAFGPAQAVATAAAIIGNFLLNNAFTFADRRLKGAKLWTGLLTFAAISAVGGAANLSISGLLFGGAHSSWWLAGVAGAAMSLVWNYAVSSVLTWRR